ncbi:MAG: hypothetical protein JWM02_290 [Frankiales bacterium]|nr:hypothetical protein [Frankiales bacterium]
MKQALALSTLGALVLLALPMAPPAAAKGSNPVIARGTCAGGGAAWKLKGKHDSGRIEMEFEVDSNRAGQRWAVRVTDNGAVVFNRIVTTAGRSGSFSVERRISNRAGSDRIVATAKHAGRTCTGRITV